MGTRAAGGGLARASDGWKRLAEGNDAVGFVDALLRGTGQVMFQNNPLTGLLFLVAIFYNSALLGYAGLLGLIASTVAALLLKVDRGLVSAGLFGFNGILVGIGLAFFLEFDAVLVVYIVAGAVVSTIVMGALASAFAGQDMPALTAPFVLTTWLLLFAVYPFAAIEPSAVGVAPAVPDPAAEVQTLLRPLPEGEGGMTLINLAHAFFRGFGEVMFQDNLVSGVIFWLAIALNSRIAAGMAAVGSAIGLGVGLALGADGAFVYHGLYGFNPLLCAIALCGVFFVASWRSALYAALAAALSAVAFASISVLLSPIGMPALTAPFVVVTWLFLLPKALFGVLHPVALAEVTTPERARLSFLARQGRHAQAA